MILLGIKKFADIIKVRIKIRLWWIRMGPKFNESPYMKQKRRHRKGDIMIEAEIEMMRL